MQDAWLRSQIIEAIPYSQFKQYVEEDLVDNIVIGVFLIHAIQIGPTMFLTSRDLVFSLFACGLIGIVIYGVIGYFGASYVGRFIIRVPTQVL